MKPSIFNSDVGENVGTSGGELLVRCLLKENVRYVFGVPGAQLLPILDAIKKIGEKQGMRFINCRHEQAAASMADAYARVTGEIGVCMGTVGPGAADLVPGVYPAFADGIPLLVITAQNQSWMCYPDRGSMQALDQYHLLKPITKWSAIVYSGRRIPELVQRAIRIALSGRQGPVHLDIPVDVLYNEVEEGYFDVYPPERYRAIKKPLGNLDLIREAARMLYNANMPLIHAGYGVIRARAWNELRELAEYLGAIVTTTHAGRGAIPEDHPLALIPGSSAAFAAQNDADVVLVVGSRMGDLDFWGRPPAWASPENQKTIQIDIEAEMIALNRPVDLAILGDAKETLKVLIEEIKKLGEKRDPPEKLKEYKKLQDEWLSEFLKLANSNEKPIHPLRVIKEVRDFYPRDAIACIDGGNTAVWAYYLHRVYEPNTFLWAADSGHLGTGLPYAIGAKLANPDKQVYLITGDGAFGCTMQELETASRENVKITVIVMNDGSWGMIKGAQKQIFGSRYIGVDFSDVRYDKVAEAMGWLGIRVEDPNDIAPSLEKAESTKKPALLDVKVSQEAHLTPPDLATLGAIWLEGCDLLRYMKDSD
ncbi:MAG: thiamine pyrophosphate-binding protein [Candidatus Nezhaarchaeales archaeon]